MQVCIFAHQKTSFIYNVPYIFQQNGVSFDIDVRNSEPEPAIRTTKDWPATTQQLEPQALPPQLAKTLEQIVGQLDVLTQVKNTELIQTPPLQLWTSVKVPSLLYTSHALFFFSFRVVLVSIFLFIFFFYSFISFKLIHEFDETSRYIYLILI